MAGRIAMGQKELLRSKILEMARQGKMTLKAAAVMTRASCRQAKRLNAAYRKEGDAGLVHGNRGRRSNNRIAEEVREKALLYQIVKANKKLPRPRDKVIIRILLDGSLSIIWKETKLLVKELTNTERRITRDVA